MNIPKKRDVLYYLNYYEWPDIFAMCKIEVKEIKHHASAIIVSYNVLEWFYSESVAKNGSEYFYDGKAEFFERSSHVDEFIPEQHYFSTKENMLKYMFSYR